MLEQTISIEGGVKKTLKAVKRYQQKKDKAMEAAIRGAGFQMRRKLKQQLRQGAPGGQPLRPLTFIARKWWSRRPGRKPLSALAKAVRYKVTSQKPYEVAVGFTGSGTWKKIAAMQQSGFDQEITQKQRKSLARWGTHLISKSKFEREELHSTPFFLRRSTKKFHTPARKIIEPFWRQNREEAKALIKKNFKLKMAGKRF